MLFATLPVAFIQALVRPLVDAITVLFVIDVLALISLAICKDITTKTMHVSFFPLADIISILRPENRSVTTNHVLMPLSEIVGPISPSVNTCTLLLSFSVIA